MRGQSTITWGVSLGRCHLFIGGIVIATETDTQPVGNTPWTGERIKEVAAYAEQYGGRLLLKDGILYLDSIPLTQVGAICRDANIPGTHWTEGLLRDIIERYS